MAYSFIHTMSSTEIYVCIFLSYPVFSFVIDTEIYLIYLFAGIESEIGIKGRVSIKVDGQYEPYVYNTY
jgi:hypothetical protein